MKREILFRGKRSDSKEWMFGDLSQINDSIAMFPQNEYGICNIIPETVGQFTGFTDKVKCKYFDGCIGEYFNCKFIVVWDNGWYAEFIETKKKRNLADFCDESVHIGNVHDNPELIS